MLSKCFYIIISFALLSFTPPCKAVNPAKADSNAVLREYEDTLRYLQNEKIKPHTSDEYKNEANQRFYTLLKKALETPGSFNYPFDSLTTLSRLTSPDKRFRILNWDVPKENDTYTFYGFVQSYNPKKKAYIVYELHDKGAEITTPQLATGTPDNWFGMLYYKIIPTETDRNTYMLLAWQGYNDLITRKIIDVISFNQDGMPTFGKAIFKHPPTGNKTTVKRILFQYSEKVYMSLEYNEAKKMILFDHIGPPDPSLEGQYQFYGPSFQVDAIKFTGKGWDYAENVDARNNPSQNDKYYHPEGEDFHKNKKAIYTPKK